MPSCLKRSRSHDCLCSNSPPQKRFCTFSERILNNPLHNFQQDTSGESRLSLEYCDNEGTLYKPSKRKFCEDSYSFEGCHNPVECTVTDSSTSLCLVNLSSVQEANLARNSDPYFTSENLSDLKLLPKVAETVHLRKRRKLTQEHLKSKLKNKPTSTKMDEVDATFNSFNYWKPMLPDIDDDIVSVLGADNEAMQVDAEDLVTSEDQEFNSFNFWKSPIPTIEDLDLEI